jgi:parallel beta-helix repeat protein
MMTRRVIALWLSLAMMLSFIMIIVEIAPVVKAPTTWYVDDVAGSGGPEDPPENFTSIQDAINAAQTGDTVFVYNGTYYENVIVNRTINLVGEDRNGTTINGGGAGDTVSIREDYVNVSDFRVTNSGNAQFPDFDAGIDLHYVHRCRVTNNNVSWNDGQGIYLHYSDENNFTSNIVSDNFHNGFYLTYSNLCNLVGNKVISNGQQGIFLSDSNGIQLRGNNVSYTIIGYGICILRSPNVNATDNTMFGDGFALLGDKIEYWNTHNIDLTNTANGKPVYYWKNQTGGTVPLGAGHVILANCTDTKVENQNIDNVSIGIQLGFCYYNEIIGNNVSSNNDMGIAIYYSNWNDVTGNTVVKSMWNFAIIGSNENNITSNKVIDGSMGIHIAYSSRNLFRLNELLSNNFRCVNLVSSSYDNEIYHNYIDDFFNRANDATSNANKWDNGYPSGGNYWTEYGGSDNYKGPKQNILGSDGIGDSPYEISSGTQDNYPLMKPYKPLENYTILKQGWNLISIPLIQIEQNLTKVLASIDGWYDAVQWYDITDPRDPWKHNKIDKPFGNDLFKLNETMGFWIHISQPGDTIFLYNGTHATSNQTITLQPGWNLVGYPSLTSYNGTEGLNNLTFNTHVDAIWTYNATTQKWEEIGPSDYFDPCKGYWIHAKVKCEWEVPL